MSFSLIPPYFIINHFPDLIIIQRSVGDLPSHQILVVSWGDWDRLHPSCLSLVFINTLRGTIGDKLLNANRLADSLLFLFYLFKFWVFYCINLLHSKCVFLLSLSPSVHNSLGGLILVDKMIDFVVFWHNLEIFFIFQPIEIFYSPIFDTFRILNCHDVFIRERGIINEIFPVLGFPV